MSALRASTLALILIDLQKAIDHPDWARHGPRNNRGAEQKIAGLLAAWRQRGLPIYHVRHDSVEPNSAYRPGQEGNEFKPEAMPLPGEIIAGVITNNSVEATVRMAGNLGFDTSLIEDACFTYARPDWTGHIRTAEEVHAMSLANLHQEYCTVITADEALRHVADYCAALGRQNEGSAAANASET